jgi:hypothetical protein
MIRNNVIRKNVIRNFVVGNFVHVPSLKVNHMNYLVKFGGFLLVTS